MRQRATLSTSANPQPILMNKTLCLTALAAALLGTSCQTRLMDMTIATTKNIDLNNVNQYATLPNARIRGDNTSHIVTVIPLGGYPSVKEAIDRAVEQNGSNCVGLSNVVFYETSWYIPLIYGRVTVTAEGDPIYKR